MLIINGLVVKGPIDLSGWHKEIIFTVFPNDPREMPQDFESIREAEEYGDEMFGRGNYQIQSPNY